MLQGSEDFGDALLVGVGGDEDMLDVFRFRGRSLIASRMVSWARRPRGLGVDMLIGRADRRTLILVAPLTDFSKEAAIVSMVVVRQNGLGPGQDQIGCDATEDLRKGKDRRAEVQRSEIGSSAGGGNYWVVGFQRFADGDESARFAPGGGFDDSMTPAWFRRQYDGESEARRPNWRLYPPVLINYGNSPSCRQGGQHSQDWG